MQKKIASRINPRLSTDGSSTDNITKHIVDHSSIEIINGSTNVAGVLSKELEEFEGEEKNAEGIARNNSNVTHESQKSEEVHQMVDSDPESDFDQLLSQQQSTLSQMSLNTQLPVINTALQLLNESPIPKKKLKNEPWVIEKVNNVCLNLKKSLGVHAKLNTNAECDSEDFHSMIIKFKEKFNDDNTSKHDKIQILTLLPPNWTINKVIREIGGTRHMVKTAKNLVKTKGILSKPNVKLGRKISDDITTKVMQFYNDDRVSVNLPGMKDYVSVKTDFGRRIHVQKRLILSNLKELYEFFCQEHPNLKIGFSSFAAMRPRHCVSAGASGTHTICVCPYHQNVKLMISGCNMGRLTAHLRRPLSHYNDCFNLILCNNPTSECYFGKCSNCPGTDYLRSVFEEIFDNNNIDTLNYQQWTFHPRATLETIEKCTAEFLDNFCEKIRTLLPHAYIAKQQANFMRTLKESLSGGEFLVISDFAENYSFVLQDAAPGYFWNTPQTTLYTVVVYYKVGDIISHKSLIVVSDCLTHDSTAVFVYTKIVIDFIKSIDGRASKVYYFSDGAPQQFKNYKHFTNLYHHKSDHGIDAEQHFFATAHGKGPCDGVSGTAKREAARASLQLPSNRQITTPQKFFEWASDPIHLPSITVKFSPKESYELAKIDQDTRFKNAKRIPDTQKLHCLIPRTNNQVEVKNFSQSQKSKLYKILKS